MSNTLLPCPFCGGKAAVVTRDVEPQGDPWYGKKLETFSMCKSCGCCLFDEYFHDGFDNEEEAIAAWNRRAEKENRPLTLDEMNALNHEPIYILHMDGYSKWSMNGWHIVTASSYRNHGRCDLEIDNGNTIIDMQNYGKTWLAYRNKPVKEEHRETD